MKALAVTVGVIFFVGIGALLVQHARHEAHLRRAAQSPATCGIAADRAREAFGIVVEYTHDVERYVALIPDAYATGLQGSSPDSFLRRERKITEHVNELAQRMGVARSQFDAAAQACR